VFEWQPDSRYHSHTGFKLIPPLENQGSGDKGIRTPDLFIANEALYQLSYAPELNCSPFYRIWLATASLLLKICGAVRGGRVGGILQ
jgi:hypothetical protein